VHCLLIPHSKKQPGGVAFLNGVLFNDLGRILRGFALFE
jgi:hypothetical protein